MILLYHKVGRLSHDYNELGVTPENFRYQLEYIKKDYAIVPLEQARDDAVSITFDDGFRDFYSEAYPYLSANRIPAAVFITTSKLGSREELWTSELLRLIFTNNCHKRYFHIEMPLFSYDIQVRNIDDKITMDRALRRLCMKSQERVIDDIIKQLRAWSGMEITGREEYGFLTGQEIKILSEDPLITIGAHTHNHISLGAFTKEYQEQEITRSQTELEQITGKKISFFSYPFGGQCDYNKETMECLAQIGICKAYTTLMQTGENVEYEISRIAVPNLGKGEFEIWFHNMMQKYEKPKEIYFSKDRRLEYIGRLEDDSVLLQTCGEIAVFGAGKRGKKIYQKLIAYGKKKEVICFIDNDKEKCGGYIDKKPIIPVERVKEKGVTIVLVNSAWEKEIIEQLIHCGIEGIHWIIG